MKSTAKILQKLIQTLYYHSMQNIIEFLKMKNLSLLNFGILLKIKFKGSLSITTISSNYGITKAATSQIIDKLVQAGYLNRSEDKNDRRKKIIEITNEGKSLIEKIFRIQQNWIEKLTQSLNEEERKKIEDSVLLLLEKANKINGNNICNS
ncbi:MAG: MarR family winged helix-turn-helix transcriptional regulator [Promethearchaeota archaeon]